jgi:glycerol-3-phosphate dehydrogenase
MTGHAAGTAYDVVLIGGGLLGCFAARSLARLRLRIAVLERHNDVCCEVSRANSAIVYAGYDNRPGTLKARLTVAANRGFDALCQELDVPWRRCGSLMVAFGARGGRVLRAKYQQGLVNGVEGLRLLSGSEALALEPGLAPGVTQALYAPSTGTVSPWELCIAAAQNAAANGVDFHFGSEVTGITGIDGGRGWRLVCSNGTCLEAAVVVNCAGLAADRVGGLVAEPGFALRPTAGDYLVLDTTAGGYVSHIVFHEPEARGKGGTFVPTVDGNLLVGPSEVEADGTDDAAGGGAARGGAGGGAGRGGAGDRSYPNTAEGLEFCRAVAGAVLPGLDLTQQVRSFATLRPNPYRTVRGDDGSVTISDEGIHSFLIGPAPGVAGFINVAGVKTPGLTCAHEIGSHVAGLVEAYLRGRGADVGKAPAFDPRRRRPVPFAQLDGDRRRALRGPVEIVCRCRQVSADDIRAALRGPLGARSLDAVKRRCGCGTGRCQGGFCGQRVIELLNEGLGLMPWQVNKGDEGSPVVKGLLVREPPAEEVAADSPGEGVPAEGVPAGWMPAGRVPAGWVPADLPGEAASPTEDGQGAHRPGLAPEPAGSPAHGGARRARTPQTQRTAPGPSGGGGARRVVIVGAGAAGLSAALAAHREGIRDILVIDRQGSLGGILPQCLHEGFGMRLLAHETTGPRYAEWLMGRFAATGMPVLPSTSVIGLRSEGEGALLTVAGPHGVQERAADAVVLATGCRERPIGSLQVAGPRPAGVLTAGAAQRMVNLAGWDVGQRIVVLGSGDVGMIMARQLKLANREVLAVVEREPACGGLAWNRRRCLDAHGIPLVLGATVRRLHGHGRLSGIDVAMLDGSRSWRLDCDTLITSLGLIPELELARGAGADMLAQAARLDGGNRSTNLPWLFVCGNARVVQPFVDDVVDDGARTGAAAARYLNGGPS